ncbi:hypothetical protein K431DRAFT_229743 [Polychaeton citri CBS 116435]|uniref:EGF-like domain-containing protein n=1 Tax=Polychaeton citri CBS 116435 TaxID=1314669 RepID=A0A9P4UMZ9_9PEZI|nr:hypothetical protein K431DRAFT_229743 [Polychaeton citri CBS 116435]
MPLGPPPSARRGPASYYAHAAPVHPIFEEAESARGSVRDGAHSSYASSNAIPIGVPEYYLTHGETQDRQAPTRPATEADDQSPYAHADQTRDYRFEGDPSRYDPSPEPAPIVRQASLGKRSKPTLTTVQSSEKMRNNNFEGEKLSQAVRPTSVSNKLSPHHGQQSRTRARSPLAKHMRESDIRKSLEAGGALEMTETRSGHLKAPTPGMSERVGRQRPPTLDMSKLKDAEARGSLTSLPDLIKRNMRLASNLDRGRTVSRLGLEWFTSDGNKSNARKSAGSLSDILSSFPAPGAQTPTGGRLNPHGSFASFNKGNLRHSTLPSDSDAPDGRTPQRRCCGMPLWLFLIMLLVLFLLVAAAVVVPVMLLVVVPDMDNSSSAPGSDCQTQLQCHNGGTGIVGQDGNCRCLCVNGYTGDSCNQSSAARCTTTTVGSVDDATVGDAIPRLLQLANSDFGIPLDGSTLLGLFSSNDLSCNTENSLVTFNGASVGKRSTQDSSRRSSTLARRQTSTESPNSQATSNGIVYQTGSPTSSSDTSASTSSSSPSSQSSSANDSSDTRDFARTVVLYIFQVSGELSSASSAQSNLQYYFSNGQSADGQQLDPTNVQLDNGYHCNLDAFSLTLANGTTVGEQSAGKKWVLG